jgi:hypothetical protein
MQDKQIAAKLKIMPEKAARRRNRFLDGGFSEHAGRNHEGEENYAVS